MPLHKLNIAKKYNFVPFILKTIYISKFLLVCGKAESKSLPSPRFYKTPDVCVYTHVHTHRHMLVHGWLTQEHSDKRVSLWLV